MKIMSGPIRVGVVGFGLAGGFFTPPWCTRRRDWSWPASCSAAVTTRRWHTQASDQARSVEEMLGDVGIQLVVIATPSYSHFELARQCLREQRNVVIDKPFTLTSAEAADLIQMARQRKLLLTAYQSRRWDGDFQTVRESHRQRGTGAAGFV